MASSQIRKIGEFIPSREDWTQYVERLEHFFLANDINAADKKLAVLLTVIGPTVYQRLQNLLSPAKLGDTTYKDFMDAMKKHVNPTPSVNIQRFKFTSRARQVEETVSTYVRVRVTVQINSNLTLARMSLAEIRLIYKFARDLIASARTCLG